MKEKDKIQMVYASNYFLVGPSVLEEMNEKKHKIRGIVIRYREKDTKKQIKKRVHKALKGSSENLKL